MVPLWLKFFVLASALFCVGGLVTTIWTTLRFGQRRRFAPAAGSEIRGIQYALFGGMMPWAKESARQHLLTYFAGVIYHVGISAGLVVLIFTLLSTEIPRALTVVLMTLLIAGAAAGIGLIFKRAFTFTLRSITTPDDIISNGLVTSFLIFAVVTIGIPEVTKSFLILAGIMLLYIPLGKIRHCFLFFLSRITFGKFFGRRGVLPHRPIEAKESHVG